MFNYTNSNSGITASISFTSFPTGQITYMPTPPSNDTLNKVAAGTAKKILQGALIDWNGAQLPNAHPATGSTYNITSTGELFDLLNEMQKEIYTLTAAVIALSNK